MAGLFFWHDDLDLNCDDINHSFCRLEYKKAHWEKMGKWNIMTFPKKLYNIDNWKIMHDGAIFGVGTFAYKGYVYEQALPLIYTDYIGNCLCLKEFWGSFIILIANESGVSLIRDGAGLTKLFQLKNNLVFSTSFAGLLDSVDLKFTFDNDSATELLSTGVITGNCTILKEIIQVVPEKMVDGLTIFESQAREYSLPKNRAEALNQQIQIAEDYFEKVVSDWRKYKPDGVLDIGMTGGMDSRLIAALALNFASKDITVFHTHWRKEGNRDSDYRYAHLFTKTINVKLNEREVIHPHDMSDVVLEKNFENAYNLCDGIIRPGCYWDEQYSTSQYRIELTETPYLRLLGFGGEQYRNEERYPIRSRRKLKSWIKWEMMYLFAGRHFVSKDVERRIVDKIEKNLIDLFGNDTNLNIFNHKKYVRCIQSPSYRSLQSSIENRLGFCLNPFLDTCLSIPLKNAIPFLGKSLSFQLDMISKISHEIAFIPNGYGFNFTKGEPWLSKIKSIFWQILPAFMKFPFYIRLKKLNRSKYIHEMVLKNSFYYSLYKEIVLSGLPIKFIRHEKIKSKGRLMINLGYFIYKNIKKIDI